MKICHMTSAHDSFDTRIFQKECVTLAKEEDFNVYLVAKGESRHEKNVNIIGIGESPKSRIKRIFLFSKLVYKTALKVDADVYHFHDPELLIYARKLKKLGKIVIFDSHEDVREQIKIKEYIPFFLRLIISKLYNLYETKVVNSIDAVIYPCAENGFTPFDNCKCMIAKINNFPIMSMFTPKEGVDKVYDICCAGSLTEERGIIELLEASKLANANLVLAGGDFSEELYKKLNEKSLLDGVICKGNCTLEEIKQLLNQSKMVVSNIHNIGQYVTADNLPTKVYEAMSMKLPVILSNTQYNVDLMNKYKFGACVDPVNVNSIAKYIRLFMNNDDLTKELGSNGRSLIEKHFSWENDAVKLVNLYRNLEADYSKNTINTIKNK